MRASSALQHWIAAKCAPEVLLKSRVPALGRAQRAEAKSIGCGTRRGVHLLANLPQVSSGHERLKPRLIPHVSSEPPNTAESSDMARRRAAASLYVKLCHRHQPARLLSTWTAPPTTLLLIQKPDDSRTTEAMGIVLNHLTTHYPHLRLIVEPHTAKDYPEFTDLIIAEAGDEHLLPLHTSMVLTLGGDGTLLHVSNLFSSGECPPVLSFSMGSLGFLLPFHIDALGPVLENALTGPVCLLNRMRLACTPISAEGGELSCAQRVGDAGLQVMNEVALHRGRYPHLTVVDAYFEGQHLTEAVADGLLLSTPTGSTAYSLSAGGPISHPDTDAFLLTPIAPRSLSFRTVILPGHGTVKLEISPLARGPVELSVDGREVCLLKPNESVVIRKSEFPIPCIERMDGPGGWARDINSLLQFNVGFRNKSLLGHQV